MSAGIAQPTPPWGRVLWLWTPVVAYMAAIFYIQSLSAPPSPPGLNDKVSHLLGYTGLGLVAARACAGGLGRRVSLASALTAVALVSGYGLADEIHQMFVPLRAVELLDWYADTAGALAGTAACMGWGILVHSRAR